MQTIVGRTVEQSARPLSRFFNLHLENNNIAKTGCKYLATAQW